MYTAIEGSPDSTPLAVLWREMYVRLPKDREGDDVHPSHKSHRTTRYAARFLLDRAMSHFGERPERDELAEVLHEFARADGDKFPHFGIHLWEGYGALDRMEGLLTTWAEGLFSASASKDPAAEESDSQVGLVPDEGDPSATSRTE